MAPPRTRKEKKAATRKAIVSAALSCFEQQGFQATSIAAITRMAGVAHGTFYVHFLSKDALLEELLADFNLGLVAELAPLWSDGASSALPEQVHRSAETFLRYWAERRVFVETYGQKVADGIRLTDLRQGLALPVLDLLAHQLERIAQESGSPLAHSRLVVQALLALWARVGLHHLFDEDLSRDEAAALLTRMTLGALQGVLPEAALRWTHPES